MKLFKAIATTNREIFTYIVESGWLHTVVTIAIMIMSIKGIANITDAGPGDSSIKTAGVIVLIFFVLVGEAAYSFKLWDILKRPDNE